MGEVSLETSSKSIMIQDMMNSENSVKRHGFFVSDRWLLANSSLASFDTKTHAVSVLTLISMGGHYGPLQFSSISPELLELRRSNFLTFSFYLLAVRKM